MNVDQEKKILEVLNQVYPRYMRFGSLSKKTGLPQSEVEKLVAYLREEGRVRTYHISDLYFDRFYRVSITAAGINYLAGKEEIIKAPEIPYCPLTGSNCNKHLKVLPNVYFVAHAFIKKKREKLRKAIEKALGKFELTPYYADEEVRSQHVACKICEKIRCSKFGIFDISGRNPNVMLELGIAWGFGKKALIIKEKTAHTPSDLEGLDRLDYGNYRELAKKIKTKIKSFVD
jgi:hypothetical protein